MPYDYVSIVFSTGDYGVVSGDHTYCYFREIKLVGGTGPNFYYGRMQISELCTYTAVTKTWEI